MSVVLDPIRNRNQRRRTLEREYEVVDSRRTAHYDEEAIKDKQKSLKSIAADIRMANGGVDRDITFQDKVIVAMAQQLLAKDGEAQPEGNTKGLEGEEKKAKEKAISEYWKKVDDTIDKVGADIYTSMDDSQKPFGWTPLKDEESQQKTIDGAIVEAVDEKNKKPKGKRAGKVTTKKIEDDGSEAEAASECVTMSEESSQETATTAEESASTSDTATETESAKTAENESTEPKTTSESTTETESGSSKRKAPLSLVPKNNKKAVK